MFMLQDMVRNSNAYSAWPVRDLASMGSCSTYKYNLPNHFYQCRLFAMQYDTFLKKIRHVAKTTILQYSCNVVISSLSSLYELPPSAPVSLGHHKSQTISQTITALSYCGKMAPQQYIVSNVYCRVAYLCCPCALYCFLLWQSRTFACCVLAAHRDNLAMCSCATIPFKRIASVCSCIHLLFPVAAVHSRFCHL